MTAMRDPKREYSAAAAVTTLGRMTFRDSPSGTSSADRAAMHDRPTPTTAAEAQAVGAVLFRAHDAARHLENLLELEAPDPRVAELLHDTKRVRKSIAALLVDVAIADVALEGATR